MLSWNEKKNENKERIPVIGKLMRMGGVHLTQVTEHRVLIVEAPARHLGVKGDKFTTKDTKSTKG